jgi:hypothetical protein
MFLSVSAKKSDAVARPGDSSESQKMMRLESRATARNGTSQKRRTELASPIESVSDESPPMVTLLN